MAFSSPVFHVVTGAPGYGIRSFCFPIFAEDKSRLLCDAGAKSTYFSANISGRFFVRYIFVSTQRGIKRSLPSTLLLRASNHDNGVL